MFVPRCRVRACGIQPGRLDRESGPALQPELASSRAAHPTVRSVCLRPRIHPIPHHPVVDAHSQAATPRSALSRFPSPRVRPASRSHHHGAAVIRATWSDPVRSDAGDAAGRARPRGCSAMRSASPRSRCWRRCSASGSACYRRSIGRIRRRRPASHQPIRSNGDHRQHGFDHRSRPSPGHVQCQLRQRRTGLCLRCAARDSG